MKTVSKPIRYFLIGVFGIALGFLGIFMLVVLYYSRVFPTVAVSVKD